MRGLSRVAGAWPLFFFVRHASCSSCGRKRKAIVPRRTFTTSIYVFKVTNSRKNKKGQNLLSKYESVKIYWLSVKFYWFKYLKRGYCKSVKFHWLLQWKLTDLTVKKCFRLIQSVIINWFNSEIYFFTGESVKRKNTDSICENLTDSDLESKVA